MIGAPISWEKFRIITQGNRCNGAFLITTSGGAMKVIMSDGGGWDHVSVSMPRRCPTWDEMKWVREMVFAPEECVLQFFPPVSKYINIHQFVLHLWRQQGVVTMLPPSRMV